MVLHEGLNMDQQHNTLRPRQKGCHFLDNIFKCIFLNENVWYSIKIPLKFVCKSPIDTFPALVQTMAWRRSGNNPLSAPMMVRLLTHICVTWPQWVNIRRLLLRQINMANFCRRFFQMHILGRELGSSGVSPNQPSRWKHAFSPLKHV